MVQAMARVRPGMRVRSYDQDIIGVVRQVFEGPDISRSYFAVDRDQYGLGGPLYIPFSAIQVIRDQEIILNYSKAQIDKQEWHKKPEF